MGGEVVYYGKPYEPIFVAAKRELHKHGAAKHPLVIGDGLETDIVGANRVKIDALFIVGGIHSALIDDPPGIAKLLAESGARARAIMPALAW